MDRKRMGRGARRIGRRASGWLVLLLVLIGAGCGYRFSPGGENIPPEIRTVFVEIFANRTSEAGFENYIRAAFVDQFLRGTRFQLTDSRETADAVLRGSIDGLSSAPLSYRATNLAAEERLTVSLNLAFAERDSGKTIWSSGNLQGTGDYTVDTANPTVTQTNRRNALAKLSNDTAEKAYRLMMSGF